MTAPAINGEPCRFLPLAVGAPMGTPLGLSPCGGFITIPLFRDWAIDLSADHAHRTTRRNAA